MTREMMNKVAANFEDAEVMTVNKNGVDKDAIVVRIGNVGATLYEENFTGCTTVEEAVNRVRELLEMHAPEMERLGGAVGFYTDYEKVKPLLRARLLPKATKGDVFRSAKGRGFADLKIIPYVVSQELGGAIKVLQSHLKIWGVSAREVIDTALKNSLNEASLESLSGFMAKMTGDDSLYTLPEGPIIVSNKEKYYGASAILAVVSTLKKKYKEGFFVLPSSVHEVLVMPKGYNGFTEETASSMVAEVNAACVKPEEVLSNHIYCF